MEAEEITKLVDGVYKNILEKFNPSARQLITTGKTYLKALHGAASASRLFNEALAKIAMNAQQSGTADIGSALMNVVSVYKEIQDQQMNILKAFYVDLLVPLETNLEKDTRVVQHEQKKFLQQHKVRMESYQKAISTIKKQRKKKNNPENTEKEIKSLQLLDDQKKKLDNFCEYSYRNAMTQERRRYGFVLERQCSIAKHWMAYYSNGRNIIENNLDNWQEVAASREVIPTLYDNNLLKRMEKIKTDETRSGSSVLKKARSVDAPFGDMRTLNENTYSQNSLPRAKSDFNLTTSSSSNENWDQRPVVKALYAYMPSGENQLPFAEGDKIALVGSKAKGWQFGENLRTRMFGWFPSAYTNAEQGDKKANRNHESNYENVQFDQNGIHSYQEYSPTNLDDTTGESDSIYRRRNNSGEESSPTRMFGDTLLIRSQKKYRGMTGENPKPGPPPTLPAPVPSVGSSGRMLNASQSFCLPNGPPVVERRKTKNPHGPPFMTQNSQRNLRDGTAKTSLHSSNDSGFANEPPPQPEADYSDDEPSSRIPIRTDGQYQSRREVERNSLTLNRNFRTSLKDKNIDDMRKSMQQATSFENMIASDAEVLQGNGIKRTKSFWRFGKSDEILTGMSLWRHRDLIQLSEQKLNEQETNDHATNTEIPRTRNSTQLIVEKERKESLSTVENYDDENIYGIAPFVEDKILRNSHRQHQSQSNNYNEKHMPKSRMKIMKSIEIDIENTSDTDRLSTLKRNRRKEYEDNKEFMSIQGNQHRKYQATSPNSTNANMVKKINNKTGSNKDQMSQETVKSKMSKTQSNEGKRDHHVSESENDNDDDDDDDNGTLKMSDVNNFFDDISVQEAGAIMKTVKRQDILKQYYTSDDDESDVEIRSTSSDPYDCIVINDHLVHKDEKKQRKMNAYHGKVEMQTFRPPTVAGNGIKKALNNNNNNINEQPKRNEANYEVETKNVTHTATILPRTRLLKSSNLTLEKNLRRSKENNSNLNTEKSKSLSKTYGPWYDFWENHDQQTEMRYDQKQ